jgi:transcriptional regulator with XRE-family HTH domain
MMRNCLKDILKREKVTAYRLWKDLGIDKGQLSRFFHGKQNISLEKLEQIAKYLGYKIYFIKSKRSRKGGKKWDASTGEEKCTGSSFIERGDPSIKKLSLRRSAMRRGS